MRKIKNVLFVCTGNSCRSVMAEWLLKRHLWKRNYHNTKVRSCGIATAWGLPPTENTIEVMKKEGIDVSTYKTNPLSTSLIREADLILVMDELHKKEVIKLVPGAEKKVHLLKEFVRRTGDDDDLSIPDPIGKPLEVYERVFDTIKQAIERLVEMVRWG